jgi:predicted nucleic-acid-binding Zn-ribbon protein
VPQPANTLILDENFDTLDLKFWQHEITLSGGGVSNAFHINHHQYISMFVYKIFFTARNKYSQLITLLEEAQSLEVGYQSCHWRSSILQLMNFNLATGDPESYN